MAAAARHLRTLLRYLGAERVGRRGPVDRPEALARFLESRASHVAQTALYGYLRTRAGLRYPALFDDDLFVASLNVAKWQIWLACLSDLAVWSGGLIAHRPGAAPDRVTRLMGAAVDAVLDRVGIPSDAGEAFAASAAAVRERVAGCRFEAVADDESAFTGSAKALVEWAPVVDDIKALDEEIVRNSMRFRWHEVRRQLRADLEADALIAAAEPPADGR